MTFATGPYAAADAEGLIAMALDQEARREGLHCGIWARDALVGCAGVEIDVANRTAKIGYWLMRAVEGTGLVTRS